MFLKILNDGTKIIDKGICKYSFLKEKSKFVFNQNNKSRKILREIWNMFMIKCL